MAALVKNEDLVPTLAGKVTKAQTVAALRAVGINEDVVNDKSLALEIACDLAGP
eukprot:gene26705-4274_t